MKKAEKAEFDEFLLDEATKFGRALTQPEIDTWFANFPTKSLREFRAAWTEHKRDERRGRFFPEIIDIQRSLKATSQGAEARHDYRCTWNGNGARCTYPVGMFMLGATEGFCIFHRYMAGGPGAQQICDESQGHTPEEYLERARAMVYGKEPPPGVLELQSRMRQVKAGASIFGIAAARAMPPPLPQDAPDRAEADAHVAAADASHLEEINRALRAAEEDLA